MRSTARWLAAAALASIGLAACSRNPEAATTGDAVPAAAPEFLAILQAAAKGYREMGRVDDLGRWAPAMCAMPRPPSARLSASGDAATHGGKLYSVYAKDRTAYAALSDPQEAGSHKGLPTEVEGLEACSQAVVKESFAPVAVKGADGKAAFYAHDARGLAPAAKDGVLYESGEPRGLFVMFRLDPKTARTDDGWVYGTVAADGTVTGCGRMASCMSCHLSAPHGHLFGLPARAP